MPKLIAKNEEAKNALLIGINKVADIVKITLGPKGNNVALDRNYMPPLITNDGVTIAKEIELENPLENMGAKLIKEASIKTNEVAGDGTTTAIVLAQSIIKESFKKLDEISPILLSTSLRYITKLLAKKLAEMATPITTNNEIKNIANISSASPEIGEMIAKAKRLVGEDGVITLSQSNSSSTDLSVVDGIRLDTGYITPYLCNDTDKQIIKFDKAKVLIFDKKLQNMQEILHILEQVAANNEKLLIICDDVDDEVLKTLIVNKVRGAIQIGIIKAPFYGEKRADILEDLSLLCGTNFYSESKGDNIKSVSINDLGNAENIIITKDTTTLLCKASNKEKIKEKSAALKEKLKAANEDEKEQIKLRLSRLCGGLAVISVGADTEIELEEKKLRIEDALSATNSAIEQGILIGGGCGIYKLKSYLDFLEKAEPEHIIAIKIMQKVIESPLRQIAENCGKNGDVILAQISHEKAYDNYGYDGLNDKFCDLMKAGIIDPAKVTITALKNACSVATTIMTTGGAVTDIPTKK